MARSRRRPRRGPVADARARLILGSSALTALAAGEPRARAVLHRALAEQRDVLVPAVAIAESTTGSGPQDAAVNRVIDEVGAVADVDEAVARCAGELRYRSGVAETIDALVAAGAVVRGTGAVILTGERRADHLRRLVEGYRHVRVEAT